MDAVERREKIKAFAGRNHSQEELQFIREDPEGVLIEDIGDMGVINHVFRVKSQDGNKSVVIKYGEEKSKVFKREITLERQALEYNALELFHSVYPGSVPRPYCFDKEFKTMAMEDLSNMSLLRRMIREGNINDGHAKLIGETLACLHYQTHKTVVTNETWEKFSTTFSIKEHRLMYRRFRIVDVFEEGGPHYVIAESYLDLYRSCVKDIQKLKIPEKLVKAYDKEECIIHYDLHDCSIFVSDSRVAIFDLEFGGLGNPAFDVSFMICNFIVSLQGPLLEHPDQKDQILTFTKKVTHTFLKYYLDGWPDMESQQRTYFISEVQLFLGVLLFGSANFQDPCVSYTVEQRKAMLQSGFELMKSQKDIKDWEDVIEGVLLSGTS